jgi:hypothetical protein
MKQVNLVGDEDVIRAFFRHHIRNLDKLLQIVFSGLKAVIAPGDQRLDIAPWVVETNSIFLVRQQLSLLLGLIGV